MKVNNGKMNIFYQNTLWRPGRDGIIELPDSYAGTLRSTPDEPDPRECKVVEWPNPESPFHDLRNTTPPARTTGVEVKPEERGQSHSAALDKLNETLAERDAAIKELTDRLAALEKGDTPKGKNTGGTSGTAAKTGNPTASTSTENAGSSTK